MKKYFFSACAILVVFLLFPNLSDAWGKKDKKKTGSPEKSAKKALVAAGKHLNKGIALRGKGKNDLALVELKKAIEIDPSAAEAYLVLADIYSDLQIPEKIVECLEPGVQLAENQGIEPEKLGRAYCQLAKSHLSLGKADLASGDISKAIVYLPDDPAPKKLLADIHIEKGRIDAGFQAYREALKLDPGNSAYWWDFGMAALQNKKLPAMQEAFLGLSRIDPIKAADFEQLMKGSKVKALKKELVNSDAHHEASPKPEEKQATATIPIAAVSTGSKPLPVEKLNPKDSEAATKTTMVASATAVPIEKPVSTESATSSAGVSEPEDSDPYAIDEEGSEEQ